MEACRAYRAHEDNGRSRHVDWRDVPKCQNVYKHYLVAVLDRHLKSETRICALRNVSISRGC